MATGVSLVPFSYRQPPISLTQAEWINCFFVCFIVVRSLKKRTSSKICMFCPVLSNEKALCLISCVFWMPTELQIVEKTIPQSEREIRSLNIEGFFSSDFSFLSLLVISGRFSVGKCILLVRCADYTYTLYNRMRSPSTLFLRSLLHMATQDKSENQAACHKTSRLAWSAFALSWQAESTFAVSRQTGITFADGKYFCTKWANEKHLCRREALLHFLGKRKALLHWLGYWKHFSTGKANGKLFCGGGGEGGH